MFKMIKGSLVIVLVVGFLLMLFFPHHTVGRIFMEPDDISAINSLENEFDWACQCQGYRYGDHGDNVIGWQDSANKASADLLYSTDEREMWKIVDDRNKILDKYHFPMFLFRWICNKVPADNN